MTMRQRLWGWLSANWSWMGISLMLALLIWVAATLEQNPVEQGAFTPVPLRVVNVAPDMIITEQPARQSVTVVLRAPRSVWEALETEDIVVTANLEGLRQGTHTVKLSASIAEDRRAAIADLQPSQVTVTLEQAGQKLFAIEGEARGETPTGYTAGSPTITPLEARVSGPLSDVERVAHVVARYSLTDQRGSFQENVDLIARDAQGRIVAGVTITPETASVEVPVTRLGREIAVNPNIIGYLRREDDWTPKVFTVTGAQATINQIDVLTTEPIDLTDRTESFTERVPIVVPPGVQVVGDPFVEVTVQIDPIEITNQFVRPVELSGLPEGYEATVEPDAVDVRVTGPRSVIEDMAEGDIHVQIDLSDLAPGTHTLEAAVFLPESGLDVEVVPQTVTVEIADIATPGATLTPTPEPSPTLRPTFAIERGFQ
jgi:YbbR domain-containing protein